MITNLRNQMNDDLFDLPRRGYVTLQIPELSWDLNNQTFSTTTNIVNKPEWFWRIKNGRLCVGKEQGFLHWSREGYLVNKNEIKKRFLLALKEGLDRTNGRGWEVFEDYAEKFYQDIKKNMQKRARMLTNQLNDVNNAMRNLNLKY